MNNVWTVLRKELLETIRDRRTIIIMIVVPVLLYPALLVLSQQLALFGIRQLQAGDARVAVVDAPADLLQYLEERDGVIIVPTSRAPQDAIRMDSIAAVAVFSGGDDDVTKVQILYDGADDRSGRGRNVLHRALGEWADTLLARRLADRGLPTAFAQPIAVADSSIALPREVGGYALGRFLPMLLILITLLGTFYPAIDLAAGEKERATLETLLMTPVPSSRIVAGKFLAVATVGVVAATLNLASMYLTFQSGLFRFGSLLDAEFSLPLLSFFAILLTLIPLAIFFGALFLGIAVRARSFKEAQNSLTPVYMLTILPALLPLFPGIDFTPALALVPIAGVALFFREVMAGTPPFGLGALAIGVTIIYAWAALTFAAKAFGSEEVLFGSEGTKRDDPRELGPSGRRRTSRLPTPSSKQSWAFVIAVAVLFFYVGSWLQGRWLERGLFLSEWVLLFGSAFFFVLLGRFDFRGSFSMRAPPTRGTLIGAAAFMIGGIPLVWYASWLQSFVLPIPWDLVEGLQDLISTDSAGRMFWLLLLVAVTPAICEEAVFRGVFLTGLRKRYKPWQTVIICGLVFGAFHVSFETAFRLVPSALLGMMFTWAVLESRSIVTSALMHFINNGTIVVLLAFPEALQWLAGPGQRPPFILLPPALFLFGMGAYLVRVSSRQEE